MKPFWYSCGTISRVTLSNTTPPPVVAVCSSKGGVGKTTICLALAAVAAARGLRVLVIDLDPQANASTVLTPDGVEPAFTVYDLLAQQPGPGSAAEAIIASGWTGVDLLPAEARTLAAIDGSAALAVEARLRRALDGATGPYDLVLIDCPPSLGRLTVNALVAASTVLIVTELGLASLEGVASTLQTVAIVQEAYSPDLTVAGIVPNRAIHRRVEQRGRLVELTGAFGDQVWPAVPDRAAVAAAFGAGLPVTAPAARVPQDVLAVLAGHTDRLAAAAPSSSQSAARKAPR